jgi:hypothetical protein
MFRQIPFVLYCCCSVLLLGPTKVIATQDTFVPLIQAMDRMASELDHKEATARLAKKFHPFVVSQEWAESLLNSVQYSKAVALTSPASGAVERIVPRTKPMSLANAYVALSLAKLDLAQYGISQPTPTQLKLALNGGKFSQTYLTSQRDIHLKGILKQRAQSHSWDTIALHIGVNADLVRYDMQAANFVLMKRVVTPSYAAIKAFPEEREEDQTSVRKEPEKAYGVGIVTANGASPAVLKSINGDNVEGIVTAGGDFIVLGLTDSKRGKLEGRKP